MKLINIDPFNIIHISDRKLYGLHNKCHRIYQRLKFKPQAVTTKVLLKDGHYRLVQELKKRNLSHKYIDDLDDGINYLSESVPKNPETKIIRNKFYPDYLTEDQIYNYYQDEKNNILKYIGNNRSVSFYLIADGEIIVKRKPRIILTLDNFDNIISGRTLSIHINRNHLPTNYVVIDIDRGEGVSDSDLLNAFGEAKKLMELKFSGMVLKYDILFTGNGLQYILYLTKKFNLNKLRELTIETLYEQEWYPVGTSIKKKKGIIQFDMSSNWQSAMHISKYSLNNEGLRVIDIREMGISLNKLKYKI